MLALQGDVPDSPRHQQHDRDAPGAVVLGQGLCKHGSQPTAPMTTPPSSAADVMAEEEEEEQEPRTTCQDPALAPVAEQRLGQGSAPAQPLASKSSRSLQGASSNNDAVAAVSIDKSGQEPATLQATSAQDSRPAKKACTDVDTNAGTHTPSGMGMGVRKSRAVNFGRKKDKDANWQVLRQQVQQHLLQPQQQPATQQLAQEPGVVQQPEAVQQALQLWQPQAVEQMLLAQQQPQQQPQQQVQQQVLKLWQPQVVAEMLQAQQQVQQQAQQQAATAELLHNARLRQAVQAQEAQQQQLAQQAQQAELAQGFLQHGQALQQQLAQQREQQQHMEQRAAQQDEQIAKLTARASELQEQRQQAEQQHQAALEAQQQLRLGAATLCQLSQEWSRWVHAQGDVPTHIAFHHAERIQDAFEMAVRYTSNAEQLLRDTIQLATDAARGMLVFLVSLTTQVEDDKTEQLQHGLNEQQQELFHRALSVVFPRPAGPCVAVAEPTPAAAMQYYDPALPDNMSCGAVWMAVSATVREALAQQAGLV